MVKLITTGWSENEIIWMDSMDKEAMDILA
jgi:hypothetical protein